MKRIILISILMLVVLTSCTRKQESKSFLENQGYKSVVITGWRPFMKSEKDFFSTGFMAISLNGTSVSGAVTRGFFKGKTIRFD